MDTVTFISSRGVQRANLAHQLTAGNRAKESHHYPSRADDAGKMSGSLLSSSRSGMSLSHSNRSLVRRSKSFVSAKPTSRRSKDVDQSKRGSLRLINRNNSVGSIGQRSLAITNHSPEVSERGALHSPKRHPQSEAVVSSNPAHESESSAAMPGGATENEVTTAASSLSDVESSCYESAAARYSSSEQSHSDGDRSGSNLDSASKHDRSSHAKH